jgi:hypothetical protein
MIDRFFACIDCKIYIDCGGRWAYWQLEEPKTVVRKQPANIKAVLAADRYWNPPNDSESRWLYEEVFPPLQTFLRDHSGHEVVFGELDYFAPIDDENHFDWMQVGYLPSLTPRYLVEVLGFSNWEQVREYIQGLTVHPAWWEVTWMDPSPHERARRRFEDLAKRL